MLFFMPTTPDPRSLKHKPIVLLPYEQYDGEYASDTDCLYLSLGWAQYDPRKISLKSMRHTGDKWSRLSEELPVHRVVDCATLLALTIEATRKGGKTVVLPVGTLEHQDGEISLRIETQTGADFNSLHAQLTDPGLRNRLTKLTDALLALREEGVV
jgi:Family of unknown function (DUF6530)